MIAHALPFVAQALATVGLLLVGTRRRLGWLLGLTANLTLIGFGWVTGEWGFALVTPLNALIQVSHLWRWRHEGWRRLVPPGRPADRLAGRRRSRRHARAFQHGRGAAADTGDGLTLVNAFPLFTAARVGATRYACPYGCGEFAGAELAAHVRQARHAVWRREVARETPPNLW